MLKILVILERIGKVRVEVVEVVEVVEDVSPESILRTVIKKD